MLLEHLFEQNITNNPNFRRWFGNSVTTKSDGTPLVFYHGSPVTDIEEFESGTTAYGIFFTPDENTADYYSGDKGKSYAVYLKIENLADFDDPETFTKIANEALDITYRRDDDEVRAFAARLYHEGFEKNDTVREFFENQDGFDQVGDDYSIEELLDDNFIDESEIDDLVNEINSPKVTDAYNRECPPYSEELNNAFDAYGTQDFYMHYQDDMVRAARNMGYDGVVMTDPSSTGTPISYIVFDPRQIKSVENNGEFDANNPNIFM